jgi:hypothetical protein
MKKLILCLILVAGVASAGTNYVVVVTQDGKTEVSSYWTTNSFDEIKEAELPNVAVLITKKEYEDDKDVKPKDRLKHISKAKITAAIRKWKDRMASKVWNDNPVARVEWKAQGKTKAQFIAAYKQELTNTIETVIEL